MQEQQPQRRQESNYQQNFPLFQNREGETREGINSIKEMNNFFPFLNDNQIRRIQEILNQKNLQIVKHLKKGGFGDIFLGTYMKFQEVAIKVMKINDKQLKLCETELSNLQLSQSRNVIKVYDGFYNQDSSLFFFIFEQCKYSLEERLKNPKELNEQEIINIFLQIINGIKYINSKKVIHSDIGPSSILFSGDEDEVKIGGFHLSSYNSKDETQLRIKAFSKDQCSPEQKHGFVTKYSDVFSAGFLLVKMCIPNLSGEKLNELRQGKPLTTKEKFPFLLKIAELMMNQAPEKRSSLSDVEKELQETDQPNFSKKIKDFFPGKDELQIKSIVEALSRRQIKIVKLLGSSTQENNFQGSDSQNKEIELRVIDVKNEREIRICENEVKNMQSINSRYVAKVYYSFYWAESSQFFISQELCSGGQLSRTLEQFELEEKQIVRISSQIMEGIIDINNSNIIHSNIDPHSIQFSKSGDVKIAGFRESQYLRPQATMARQRYFSLYYSPLEQIEGHVKRTSDLFSAGVVITQMCIPNVKKEELLSLKYNRLIEDKGKYPNLVKIAEKIIRQDPPEREKPQKILEFFQYSQIQITPDGNQLSILEEITKRNNFCKKDINDILINLSKKVKICRLKSMDQFGFTLEGINRCGERVLVKIGKFCQDKQTEAEALKQMNSNYVIKQDDYWCENSMYVQILESCDQNLDSYLNGVKNLDKKQILKIFTQMCKGVQDLHSQNIIHNDLSPESFLVKNNNDIKLCNLESSILCNPYNDYESVQQGRGNLGYGSPERIYKSKVGKYSDVYSLGCILFQLLQSFCRKDASDQMNTLKSNPEFSDLIDLRDLMIKEDPKERIKLNGVLEKLQIIENNQSIIDGVRDYFQGREHNQEEINAIIQDLTNYSLKRILGKGSFGIVVEVEDNQQRKVAIKLASMKQSGQQSNLALFKEEGENMKAIQSENVLSLFHYEIYEQKGYCKYILELCQRTLQSLIDEGSNFSEDRIKNIMRNIFNGLIDMHAKNIVHSDLKPENILLTDKGECKICDLGFSIQLSNPNIFAEQKGFTLNNCAPEQSLEQIVTKESDIFAAGTILVQLLCPNVSSLISLKSNTNLITEGNYPNLRNLAIQLLAFVPNQRISLQNALQLLNY